MKNLKVVLGSLIAVILLAGCGNKEKTLECTHTESASGVDATQVINLKFDSKDKYTGGTFKQDMKLTEEQAANLDVYKQTLETSFKSGQYKNFDFKITDNGKDTITVTMDLDVEGLKKMANQDDIDDTYKATKESFEKANYVCK